MKCLDCKEGLTVEANHKVCKTCSGRGELFEPKCDPPVPAVEESQDELEETVEEAGSGKPNILKRFWN